MLGDKGGGGTKLTIAVANVEKTNSFENLLLVAIYDGTGDYEHLKQLRPVFKQLSRIQKVRLNEFGLEKAIKWQVTGDLMFLSAIYGHLGPASTHPCLKCLCPSDNFHEKDSKEAELRTVERMMEAANDYNQNKPTAEDSQKLITEFNRQHCSIARQPLVSIPIEDIIPSSLHIVMSICEIILKLVEKEAAKLGRKKDLKRAHRDVGADRSAHFQSFTGNHVHRLLSEASIESIGDIIQESEKAETLESMMSSLGRIQSLSAARTLQEEEIQELKELINNLFAAFRTHTVRKFQ